MSLLNQAADVARAHRFHLHRVPVKKTSSTKATSGAAARPVRSPDEIENDFANLLVSRLPVAVTLEKFERLWDETNSAAAQFVPNEPAQPYISLLKRMHETFERYNGELATRRMNGFHRM